MIELTEHTKTILRAIADGETIEQAGPLSTGYVTVSTDIALYMIRQGLSSRLRIGFETRCINGKEFVAPVSDSGDKGANFSLQIGQRLFWFDRSVDRDEAELAIFEALHGVTK